MKRFLLTSAMLVVLIPLAPANAADVSDATPVQAMAPLSVYRWTGLYGGVNGGLVSGNAAISWSAPGLGFRTTAAEDVNASSPGHVNTTGFTGGGQLGYNRQIQSILLGAEADLGYTGISGSRSFFSIRYHNPYAQTIDSKWLTTFRGRFGFVDGTWLGYATGGLAVANVSSTDRFIGEHGVGPINGSADQARAGWTAGVGIERAFGPQWTGRFEYLHVGLGATTDMAIGTIKPAVINHDHSLTEDIVRAAIDFRFD
jgi:outer membrane immunogenic protein